MLRLVLLACTLLSWCKADLTFGATNSMLDPNRITWWRSKWAPSPITLSSNNKSISGVTVNFYICPTTSISNGIFEVTFPSGFVLATAGNISGQTIQISGVTLTGGQDSMQSITTGVSNPITAGSYGPFSLRTRYSEKGQQVDVNLNFGSVYIYGDAPSFTALEVKVVGAANTGTIVNTPSLQLSFKFTISQSLWKYDTIIITADNRWTIAAGAACSSADTTGKLNNFNGTNSANPHALQCAITQLSTTITEQQVFIYGLAVDGLDTTISDNQFLDLRVSSITAPKAVYPSNPYSWTVTTNRFGTTTMLEKGTYASGPVVTTGTLTSVTWAPTWGSATSTLATGHTVFMDLSFSVANQIPEGGYVTIGVSEYLQNTNLLNGWMAGMANTDNCYVITPITRSVSCKSNAQSTYLITGLPLIATGVAIKIRSVVYISSTASNVAVSSITTYMGVGTTPGQAGYTIDTVSNQASFALSPATSIKKSTISFTYYDGTTSGAAAWNAGGKYDGSGNLQNYKIRFGFNSDDSITASSVFTINCPFSNSLDDLNIGLGTLSYNFVSAASALTTSTAMSLTLTNPPGTPTLSSGTTSLGMISFTAAYSTGSPTYDKFSYLEIGKASGNSITLPRVAANYATYYECKISISGTPSQVGFVQLPIVAQTWATGATHSVRLPCLAAANGVPAIVSLNPQVTIPTATAQTYYVEVEITLSSTFEPFSTNVAAFTTAAATDRFHDPIPYATEYPFSKSSGTSPSGAKLYRTSTTTNIFAFAGFSGLAYSASAPAVFYFPIGGLSASGVLSATVRSLYFLADGRYKFITHEEARDIVATGSTASFLADVAIGGNTNAVATNTQTGINGNTLTTLSINLIGPATASQAWFFVVLPSYWQFSGSNSVKLGASASNTSQSAYYFSAANYKYPAVLFSNQYGTTSYYDVSTATVGSGATGTISISGLTMALGASTSNTARVAYGAGGIGTACSVNVVTTNTFSTTSGAISSLGVVPNSIKARGADGVSLSHTVTFTLAHIIPLGGSINMQFNGSWLAGYSNPTTCSGCSVTGLTALSATNPISCALSGNTVTVNNFAALSTAGVISITIFGLQGPTTATTGTPITFVTSLKTNIGNAASAVIDEYNTSPTTGNEITVATRVAKGNTTWSTNKKTYPSNAGAQAVDMYLKFSLPHSIPVCGTITITSPLGFKTTGDIRNNCFFSPLQYTECSVSSTVLTLTLNQAYSAGSQLELYVDGLVDNPTTFTTTSSGFMVVSSWGSGSASENIDEDITSTQTFTPTAVLTSTITGSTTSSLSYYPKTAGETATYVFDFKDSANFAATDQYWIVFPSTFDYFLGDTWTWFNNEPNVYYIECSSTQLGTTWCQVDHNIVIVSGSNAITGSTQIVITINNIVNPIATQTSDFQIYHVDTNGNFITVNQLFGKITPQPTAVKNIGVRSLTMSDSRIFKSADYSWRLYLEDAMNTDSQLQVLFPREYNLRLFDKKDTYSCTSTWLDISATATIKTQQNWNSASSCTASNNLISLSSPTTSITFNNNHIVTLTVQSVGNPQFGQSRSAAPNINIADFDVTDNALWPVWAYWASKYTFFVYRTSTANLFHTSRSYPNMNTAYANFYDGYRPLLVNGYSPQAKTGRILVYAGTQTSDVYLTTEITTKPMAAKQIVFTPTTNSRTPDGGKLKYTSVQDSWTLFQSYYSIQFRVCAAIDTTKGLYYIDWSNNETKQTGLNDVQYDIPASTLVEVVGKSSGKYTFAISTIPNVSTGFTSVPIKVTITNAPCTDVTVNIAVSNTPANISVTPTALIFGPDVNSRYFQIQVASNYDLTLGTVQTLLFTLTGTDAFAFAIAASTKFTITQPTTTQTPGNIVSWGLGQPAKTSMTVSPSSDQIGVIYYQLAAAGTAIPSFSTLKSSVTSLINQNGTTGGDGKDDGANSQSDPQTGETWEDFQRRLLKQHLQTQWNGSISMYATTAVTSLTFTWLWAAIPYQISGYLDNLSTSSTTPTVRTETFTTLAIADSQPIAIKFTGSVPQSFSSKIINNYASVVGVNPTRLVLPGYSQSNSRVLADATTVAYTTFAYTLLVNRFSESPSPTDQAKVTGTAEATLRAMLITDGLPSANPLNTVTNTAIQSSVTPTWSVIPASGGSTVNSVTVNLKSSTAGRSCCVALTGSSTAPTAEQVMLGLDAANTAASGTCITTDMTTSSNSVQVSSLQSSTAYYVYCTATDTKPLWPTYMAYSTSSPMTPVSITTLSAGEVIVDGASYLGGLLALLALLFN